MKSPNTKRATSGPVATVMVGNTTTPVVLWSNTRRVKRRFAWPTNLAEKELAKHAKPIAFKETVVLAGVVPQVVAKFARQLSISQSHIANRKSKITLRFRKGLRCPLTIRPRPASEVGDDRLAAALGALAIDPRCPWVVVDAGTALTVNAVKPALSGRGGKVVGVFEGGLIVPGEGLSLRALGQAAQLPVLTPPKTNRVLPVVGLSTKQAIQFGVRHAQTAVVVELVRAQAKVLGPKTRVVLTGGGADALWPAVRRALKSLRPLRDSDLVHRGLLTCSKASRSG